MRGAASACASATVINAIASGKGAAFALNLRVRAEVNLIDGSKNITGKVEGTSESPELVEFCVRKVLEQQGTKGRYGGEVRTSADFPIAVGLSSSSAAANAAVLATFDALGGEPDPKVVINLGIDAAFEAGTTVTGAFDDAAASFLGGGIISDNSKRCVLKRFKIEPNLVVLIYLPQQKSYTSQVNVERPELLTELVEFAHKEALSGNIYGAQTLNGLLYCSALKYDSTPALDALEAGALSAGLTGTGPATVAISEKRNVEKIKNAWKMREGEILAARPSIEGARVEEI